VNEPEPQDPEPQADTCPPLHQLINNTCIPLLQCSSSDNNNNNNNNININDPLTCKLMCDPTLMNNDTSISLTDYEATCVIEGDMVVNGSIVETNSITIVGVINVTGSVIVKDDVTLKLSLGSVLHVGMCLVLEEGSEMVVSVEGGVDNGDGYVVTTFDGMCSSTELAKRVRIEQTSSCDECRDGRPQLQQEEDESGRARLELLFVPVDSSECNDGSDVTMLAIAIAVPIGVLMIVVIIVVMAVPKPFFEFEKAKMNFFFFFCEVLLCQHRSLVVHHPKLFCRGCDGDSNSGGGCARAALIVFPKATIPHVLLLF